MPPSLMHEKTTSAQALLQKPRATVAAIIVRPIDGSVDGPAQYLMVEELIDGKIQLNQPAGHIENNENIINAVKRETLEETAWDFIPQGLTGIYQWSSPAGISFIRLCFYGHCNKHHPQQALDSDIIRALWLTHEQIVARTDCHRSPLVNDCLNDYLSGSRHALDLVKHL